MMDTVPNLCYGNTSTWVGEGEGEKEGRGGEKLSISSILPLPDVHTSLESEQSINTL